MFTLIWFDLFLKEIIHPQLKCSFLHNKKAMSDLASTEYFLISSNLTVKHILSYTL